MPIIRVILHFQFQRILVTDSILLPIKTCNIEYSLNTHNHILMILSGVPYSMKEKFLIHAIALSISLNVYLLHEKIPVRFVGAQ